MIEASPAEKDDPVIAVTEQVQPGVEQSEPEPAPEAPPASAPEAPAEAAPAPEPGVEFVFLDGKEEKAFTFTKGFLGITFNPQMPLVVTAVREGCQAKGFGVSKGWKFLKVGGQSLEKMEYKKALEHVQGSIANLPKP